MNSEDKAFIVIIAILCFTFVVAPLLFAAVCVITGC